MLAISAVAVALAGVAVAIYRRRDLPAIICAFQLLFWMMAIEFLLPGDFGFG